MGNHGTNRILLFQLRLDNDERDRELRAFAHATGAAEGGIRAVDVLGESPRIDMLDGMRAMVIGGSKYSVFEDVPNQDALIAVLKEARARRVPVLGCCYGAQLIAHAFGGEVIRDEANEEVGSFVIRASEDAWTDMLFADAPDEFYAQCAHHDHIAKLPAGAMLLASSDKCAVQAFSIPGTDIYAFQFHPERNAADFNEILTRKLTDHGATESKFAAALASLRESPEAEAMLRKFMERIVAHAKV